MAPHSDHETDFATDRSLSVEDIPVLIIGGGPTGLLLAHLLSHLNVKSLVIERYPTRLAAPKAHALSPRSLEFCRQFGIDVNEIRKLGTKRADAYWVNFLTGLGAEEGYLGSLPYERMDPEVLSDTPCMIHNIPQPTFEEFVAEKIQKQGVEVRKGHSFVSCEQDGSSVMTTIENRNIKETYQIRSQHVVGCDGAKSKVREFLDIQSEGESSDETMMTIHFSADLRSVVGKQVGMLHWVMNPEVSGFIIGYDLNDNQVLICNFDPEKLPVDAWDDELCRKAVTAAVGNSVAFKIHSYRPWVLTRKVADSYRVGNVFLAGDAAHSFPPTGGLGLNSGLGDVHNLAYKLAAVHQGWGKPSILDTYQTDRRQIALVNSQQSIKNGKAIFGLLKTFGMASSGDTVQKAQEDLVNPITNPRTRASVLKGVEAQREHFDNLGLHIGYIYGDLEYPASASLYTPSFGPGARLPHAWIEFPQETQPSSQDLPPIDSSYVLELSAQSLSSMQYSTLDLCKADAFTLLVSEAFSSQWDLIVSDVRLRLPKSARELKITIQVLGRDFELISGSRGEEWKMGMQLERGSGVLVRPDQHILNSFRGKVTGKEVWEALGSHLGFC